MNTLQIQIKYNDYQKQNVYLIYNNNYYLELGNKHKLLNLLYIIRDFTLGKLKNTNDYFKIWFSQEYFYIENKLSLRRLSILRSDLSLLQLLLEKELCK